MHQQEMDVTAILSITTAVCSKHNSLEQLNRLALSDNLLLLTKLCAACLKKELNTLLTEVVETAT